MTTQQKRFLYSGNILKHIIVAVCLAIFLILLSVTVVTYSKWFYAIQIDHLDIKTVTNMNKEEIEHHYNTVIDYLYPLHEKELVLPTLPMSTEGKIHFEDVRNIFMKILLALLIFGILSLFGSIWLVRKKQPLFLLYTAIWVIFIPILLGAFIILYGFENSFNLFHELSFSNDYWVFDPQTDPIIYLLPIQFFMYAFMAILGLISIGSIVCFQLYFYMIKKG
ncbi:TIGR01906 family membrane protein [Hazenella sp. IB182357]|uniref:TIGR01906 family membrane protein n=1 Tax=Polycladospora coralii TaxID=2771432 RepID=A0A926RTG8_9BACL|nr:TIGR01906 family membrane protein [Polycladospora coralii]MBD1371683.1 TIGR01906 family membrane protein [Polycladospora coralii]MBS7529150.1 TIGR01906 family membrane protein [Polycladospora coralii]